MFKLVIQDDEGKTTVVPLIRDEITIGRKEGNTIRLTERNVSRRHARILRNNGEVHIEDLGSYNGIRVNNARIAERANLRVSDQVQIGDYKLYLKAEGVEHVDDARTLPIERVDTLAKTDPSVGTAASGAPTAPLQVPATPQQLIGNPNHTLVALGDTPMVTARPVNAGHGKLVVLSSNFAGKEFELTKPQMIVGRTDENDLVINHRSISRNHAKLVREPDTGRYTISDLQSSNGVRVNGQDYGKVELRRGDVVDLGHVRLRFVEAGEDFVFARDAVITDVPDATSKKGLAVAVALGIVVLAGVVIFLLTRNDTTDPKQVVADGSQATSEADAGHGPIVGINTPDAAEPIANPLDAGDPKGQLESDCTKARNDKDWRELELCGAELAKFDPIKGKELKDRAVSEARAEVALRALGDAVKAENVKEAQAKLASIGEGSIYRKEAETAYRRLERSIVEALVGDLRKYKTDCKAFNLRLHQAETSHGAAIANEGRARVKCETKVEPPNCTESSCPAGQKCGDDGKCRAVAKLCTADSCPAGQKCGDDGKCKTPVVVAKPECDPVVVDEAEKRGNLNLNQGNFAAALAAFESVLKCKPGLIEKTYLAACRAKKAGLAKTYYRSLPAAHQVSLSQMCFREGIDPTVP